MEVSFRLDGRIALVTGGGRGIGRGIAKGLAEAGAALAVWDIDGASAADTASEVGDGSAADEGDVTAGAAVGGGLCRGAWGPGRWVGTLRPIGGARWWPAASRRRWPSPTGRRSNPVSTGSDRSSA